MLQGNTKGNDNQYSKNSAKHEDYKHYIKEKILHTTLGFCI